jgi:hypothetical protein
LSLLAQVEASLAALPCPKAGLPHPHHEVGSQEIKLLAQNAWRITHMAGSIFILPQVLKIGKLQIASFDTDLREWHNWGTSDQAFVWKLLITQLQARYSAMANRCLQRGWYREKTLTEFRPHVQWIKTSSD